MRWGMVKVAPFETAIDALKIMNELAILEYQKQAKESVEFVVSLDELKKILQLLIQSMTDASATVPKFKKDLKAIEISLPKDLPETLFRTITMACYQSAHWKNFVEHKNIRPYLMYDAIMDSRIRENHAQADGIIRRVDDRFWQTNYPPNGINCRCNCISLNDRQARERSKDNQGLNKFITCKMKPDKGWDFNIGENLDAFVKVGVVGLVRKDAVYSAC